MIFQVLKEKELPAPGAPRLGVTTLSSGPGRSFKAYSKIHGAGCLGGRRPLSCACHCSIWLAMDGSSIMERVWSSCITVPYIKRSETNLTAQNARWPEAYAGCGTQGGLLCNNAWSMATWLEAGSYGWNIRV